MTGMLECDAYPTIPNDGARFRRLRFGFCTSIGSLLRIAEAISRLSGCGNEAGMLGTASVDSVFHLVPGLLDVIAYTLCSVTCAQE